MISAVIPLYNKADTIQRAIQSVILQTYPDWELIVVDNGSTDGGGEKVQSFSDQRIHLVRQENLGVSMARNRGIQESQCEYIAFLDADDEWKPQFLEQSISLQKAYPGCDIYASSYERCTPDGGIHPIHLNSQLTIIENEQNSCILDNYFAVAATSDPPFCSISVMVRKEALLAIGGFPMGIHQGEDLLTWARLAATGRIAYCNIPQSIFHIGNAQSNGLPKRIPDPNDPVGKGLEQLYTIHSTLIGLPEYISLWHKMRANIYLRLPKSNRLCRKEIIKSRQWDKKRRLYSYFILSFIPYAFRMKVLQILKKR